MLRYMALKNVNWKVRVYKTISQLLNRKIREDIPSYMQIITEIIYIYIRGAYDKFPDIFRKGI